MSMRPLRFQEHHTFNLVRWLDAHLDASLHNRINGLVSLEMNPDFRVDLQHHLRYALIPVIEEGRVVVRVQVWLQDIATATLIRDLPELDADGVYLFAGKVIESIQGIWDQRQGGNHEADPQ